MARQSAQLYILETKLSAMQDPEFEEFWRSYPRKVAKADARKAWLQTRHLRPSLDVVLRSLKAACRSEQWMKGGGQFIPHASTWLRGERWEDEYEVVMPDVVNEKPWYETGTGIEAKGKEYGLEPSQFDHWQTFKYAVLERAKKEGK